MLFRSVAATPVYTEGGLFEIFPNPVSDILNIRFLLKETSKKHVEIININGQIVLTKGIKSGVEHAEIDVSELPKGVYFIRLNIDNQGLRNYSGVQKFIRL